MARLSNHGQVIKRLKDPASETRVHLAQNGKILTVLKTTGPRMGGATVVRSSGKFLKGDEALTYIRYKELEGWKEEAI